MKKYQVGGAVRDQMLGLEPMDRDWLVTGATGDYLKNSGYKQVGLDFPVFLHPETNEEHALPRGIEGDALFTMPHFEQLVHDLKRRDFTVNAMAIDENKVLVDPCHGMRDLELKVLRHVSEESFREDPIRILRLARLAARLDFAMADETVDLARRMVAEGVLSERFGPRIKLDILKGVDQTMVLDFIDRLSELHALPVVLPAVNKVMQNPDIWEIRKLEVDRAVNQGVLSVGMLALMMKGAGPQAIEENIALWRGHTSLLNAALMIDRFQKPIDLDDHEATVTFIEASGATRVGNDALFHLSDIWALQGFDSMRLMHKIDQVRTVKGDEIAAANKGNPEGIKRALHEARVQAVALDVVPFYAETPEPNIS